MMVMMMMMMVMMMIETMLIVTINDSEGGAIDVARDALQRDGGCD